MALDKQLRELQDGPVRDMLRLALHLGVRACKPGPDPGNPIDQVTAELDRIKMQARSTVSLCFSLLSEIHSSRREMMWKIQGAKASELRGRWIFEPEDQESWPASWRSGSGSRSFCRSSPRPTKAVAVVLAARAAEVAAEASDTDSEVPLEQTTRRASLPPRTVNRLLQLPQLLQPRQPQLRPSRPSLLAAPRRVAAGAEGDARNDPHCADVCR